MNSEELPICDNHAHANAVIGMGPRELARRFRREGGKFIVMVSLLTWSLGLNPGSMDDVRKLYDYTIEAARVINEEGIKSVAVVGLHPAEGFELIKRGWSLGDVEDFMRKAIDLAGKYVSEGKAVGIGEVGRPHWEVDERIMDFFNGIIKYALGVARDVDGVVHLHLERNGLATTQSIIGIAREVNIKPYRVIMHHAQPVSIDLAFNNGLMPSIPMGRRGEFEEAVKHGPRFLVESDFIDDPRRPGAVIPPWTLARKLRNYVSNGLINRDFLVSMCHDNILKVYGINIT
ncbi:TatD family hydrolase [Vulcanisaeta thermophila]|uniref:TatD family hydrolase n=1 Tax=Vulcanisaeta thermophila TaxID=867917 RepID=UPI000A9FCF77|nr:TatD family hydrolase [Vulcanisaeta thermophila]